MTSNRDHSVIGAATFILGLSLLGYIAVGFAGVFFTVAFVGGFVLWTIEFLCSAMNTAVTGEIIRASGGITCARAGLRQPPGSNRKNSGRHGAQQERDV